MTTFTQIYGCPDYDSLIQGDIPKEKVKPPEQIFIMSNNDIQKRFDILEKQILMLNEKTDKILKMLEDANEDATHAVHEYWLAKYNTILERYEALLKEKTDKLLERVEQ